MTIGLLQKLLSIIINIKSVYTILLLWLPAICIAQKTEIRNDYVTAINIPHLSIETSMVYLPDSTRTYSHHASITHFKNKLIAV
mgnify:FL=1